MRFLFICNANKKVGLGHLSRCRIIAKSLQKSINKCEIYFSGDIEINFLDSLSTDNLRFVSSPNYEDYDCVILDSYDKDDFYKVDNLNLKKIAIDDRALETFVNWDLVLNFRVNPTKLNYESKEICVGTSFFPFDERLILLRLDSKPQKEIKNLFFYFGETKKITLNTKSLELIEEFSNKYNFFISANINNQPQNFETINISNFFNLFSKSDVIISGGGLTKYEAAFTKKINLTFSINELQKQDTEILSNLFLTKDMGYFKDINNSLIESIKMLENLKDNEIELFYKNSSKYFYTNSLANMTQKISSIVL